MLVRYFFGFCGKSGQYSAEKVLKSSHNNTEKVWKFWKTSTESETEHPLW